MITIQIQKVAKEKGVKNAYQFQKISGFPMPMASRLFKGKWKRVDISTMDTICNSLKCTPSEIMNFTPDPDFDNLHLFGR
jgi:DNA-binding Xre family transcriptional regulator